MEMCYNEALVMPSNYVVMNNEEMEYLDSGWCIENTWWGYNIYLTHEERKTVTSGQMIVGLAAALATMGVGAAIVAAVSGLIWNYDDGYGVRLRMTGPLKFNAVLTGIFSLTANEQSEIASLNKILF